MKVGLLTIIKKRHQEYILQVELKTRNLLCNSAELIEGQTLSATEHGGWKGRKFNLKTKPTDGLEETDGKCNKPEQGMEEYSFDSGDVEVNGEMKRKRYWLEVEKNRT